MNADCELNMEWENEYIRTTECDVTCTPEPMDKIRVQLLYVNTQNQIDHSTSHQYPLTVLDNELGSELSETTLMQIIHSHRNLQNKRYKCDSVSYYCLSCEPTKMFERILLPDFQFDTKPYFSSFDLPRTIRLPPSLFIFHSLNSIWIIFRELVLVNQTTPAINIQPASILKRQDANSAPKKTKRVRISADLPVFGKTRKRLP